MNDNIIAIRKCNISKASDAFDAFMKRVEGEFNSRSQNTPNLYTSITPNKLEEVTLDLMKDSVSGTPFRRDEIKLISGHSFPDIVAEQYYGVEVKCTKSNNWKSTGSSIVESTRVKDVEDIYLLFGNLGATPPQFLCRPYSDCLSEITVTHSPRYLIDMQLGRGETIFDKMCISYDQFRTSDDSIAQVRRYYREKSIKDNKGELPWWLNKSENENSLMIKQFRSLSLQEKEILKATMLLLFNNQIIRGEYDEAAVWLLTSKRVVNSSFRDLFSAGGRFSHIRDNKGKINQLKETVPAIVERLINAGKIIRNTILIENEVISLYNENLLFGNNIYDKWIESTILAFRLKYEIDIPLKEWIENNYKLLIVK